MDYFLQDLSTASAVVSGRKWEAPSSETIGERGGAKAGDTSEVEQQVAHAGGGGKRNKKNKGKAISGKLLGFTAAGDPNRFNAGEIDYTGSGT